MSSARTRVVELAVGTIATAGLACNQQDRDPVDPVDDGIVSISDAGDDATVGDDDEDDDAGDDTVGEDDSTDDDPNGAGDDDDRSGSLFDVGSPSGELPCGSGPGIGDGGSLAFSYIWVANSPQNTISKIATQTLVEEGRYETSADFGNPSRTSVSLSGHVAVANRFGGVTKFYAHDCPDPIATSTGPGDVYPFGTDGCFAWHTPMQYDSQRPVAWAPGTFDEESCRWENERVWTAGCAWVDGVCPTIDVLRLDGETGVVLDEIQVAGLAVDAYGAYGGASDGEGNFWFSQLGIGTIGRVSATDPQDVRTWPMPVPGYGVAIDGDNRLWICGGGGIARFTYGSETWDVIGSFQAGGSAFGCMADATHLWLAGDSLRGIHLDTMGLTYDHALPSFVRGTSIDFEGYVWGVSMDTRAYRVEPTTGAMQVYEGLDNPYSYSDMTGFGLYQSFSPQG